MAETSHQDRAIGLSPDVFAYRAESVVYGNQVARWYCSNPRFSPCLWQLATSFHWVSDRKTQPGFVTASRTIAFEMPCGFEALASQNALATIIHSYAWEPRDVNTAPLTQTQHQLLSPPDISIAISSDQFHMHDPSESDRLMIWPKKYTLTFVLARRLLVKHMVFEYVVHPSDVIASVRIPLSN